MNIRRGLQWAALAAAGLLVWQAFTGPDFAPRNLATVAVWVHWRGLLILALLVAGNIFCSACPFTLVRDLARRFTAPARRWPRALRTKAPALALFAFILFAYERWGLWSSPVLTGAVILAYFGAALLVDASFTGAPFCKYVCPLGQFNFAASALSPFEVAPKDLAVCASCRTKDCLRGRHEGGILVQRGCELGLFLPRKVGNMDCTFCMDCVAACPEDNAGFKARLPGAELFADGWRSGVGRPSKRPDLAALSALFLFGALLNAWAMTSPAYAAAERLAAFLGSAGPTAVLAVEFILGLAVLPAILLAAAAALSRGDAPLAETAYRYAPCLLPLGVGMWAAHYGFHFLTGLGTIVPAAQAAAFGLLGEPAWNLGGMSPGSAQGLGQGLLALGLAGSWAVAARLAAEAAPERARAAAAPWAVLLAGLWLAGAWVLTQPMEMRGVLLG